MTDEKFIPSGKLQKFMEESSMKGMEQPEAKTKESEQKTQKIEQADIKVEFITEGEKMRMDEEKERAERVMESSKLSAENEKTSQAVLKESSDEILRNLAEEYYKENEEIIRQKTKVYDKNISREAKYDIVRNLGAFDEIKNKKGNWTEESFGKFAMAEGYDEIRAQLKLGKTGMETPALLMNALEKNKEELQKKLNERDKKSLDYALNGEARLEALKKYNNIFSAQIELAEKIYGESLLKENDKKNLIKFGYFGEGLVDDKALSKEKEAEALKEIKEKIFGTKWGTLSKEEKDKHSNDFNQFVESNIEKQIGGIGKKYGIDEKTALSLMENGYYPENFSIKMKSFRMGSKFYLAGGGDGVSEKEFNQFIKKYKENFEKEVAKKSSEKINQEWTESKELFLGLREKISKLAKNPEKAEGGIVKAFTELKEKTIKEGIKNSLKKEEKTKEELEKITKEFSGGKEEASQFLEAVISRKGLEELTGGEFDENIDTIGEFLGGFGISTEFLDNLVAEEKSDKWSKQQMEKIRKGYKANAKNKKGLVSWMVEMVATLMNPPSKPQQRQGRRP